MKIKALIDKLEDLLEVDILRNIVAGLFVALTGIFFLFTFATAVLIFTVSAWWTPGFFVCGTVFGAVTGFTAYIFDKRIGRRWKYDV